VQAEQRIVVIVSSDPSDIYFANQLAKRLGIVGIVVEHQGESGGLQRKFEKAMRLLLHPRQLYDELQRRSIEKTMRRKAHEVDLRGFGADGFKLRTPANCQVVHVHSRNAANSPEAVAAIRGMQPDIIAVCGASILKDAVLSIPSKGVLNLHGGLPQKYRGIWTTHWAVVNEEPEYIGATVHHVSAGIDDGDIVFQGRPRLDGTENPESLYVKVVKLGVGMMIAAIGEIRSGKAVRYPLEIKGRLYLGKMVTPEILQQAWANTERGVIRDYLANKAVRDAAVISLMRGVFSSSEEL
jgi:folate-dependent phosphoribosylglycinamide formyltransferase PurN